MGLRVVLRAGFDVFSGYGNDAVDMAMFMDKAGVDVLPWPTSVMPGLPERMAKLLMKDPRGPKDVVLAFAPPDAIRPWEFANLAPKAVGWTMWERTPYLAADLADVPEWQAADPGTKQRVPFAVRAERGDMFGGLDELIVTCPMNVEAFGLVNRTVPMSVIPNGIDPDKWPVEKRDPARPMTFLMVGMLAGRKNPFALLDAWRDLKAMKPEFDARLHLHTLAPGLHPAIADGAYGPGITITNRPLSHQELTGLYLSADVLVSTSRGEGNNKPAMEFMATGGTVIAPRWGGHENWMNPLITFDCPFEVREDPVTGTSDVEVDHYGLMDALLLAWNDRAGTSRRGLSAATFVRDVASWPNVVARLVKRLEAVCYG